MDLQEYIPPTAYLPRLDCRHPGEVIERLVGALTESGCVGDAATLCAEVIARESDTSTAVGSGLAIPHTRSNQVDRIHLAVATLDRPVSMPSADGRPVDVFILIVGPDSDPRPMLRVLARLVRLVKDAGFLAGLRQAGSVTALRDGFAAAS